MARRRSAAGCSEGKIGADAGSRRSRRVEMKFEAASSSESSISGPMTGKRRRKRAIRRPRPADAQDADGARERARGPEAGREGDGPALDPGRGQSRTDPRDDHVPGRPRGFGLRDPRHAALHRVRRSSRSARDGARAIAVPILFGAPKERRFSLPHTRFLLHQPSGGAGGQATDIRIEAEEILKVRDTTQQPDRRPKPVRPSTRSPEGQRPQLLDGRGAGPGLRPGLRGREERERDSVGLRAGGTRRQRAAERQRAEWSVAWDRFSGFAVHRAARNGSPGVLTLQATRPQPRVTSAP